MTKLLTIIPIFLSILLFSNCKKHAHWGYEGKEGPDHWGELGEDYRLCQSGKNQSPINLTNKAILDKHDTIEFHYSQSTITLNNNGHTIQENYDEGSYIVKDDVRYNLKQFHFHSHSEHSISGKFFPIEIHLVHTDDKGNLAVIGIFVKEGKSNEDLAKLFKDLPAAGDKIVHKDERININHFIPENKHHFSYNGSLTTPPCSEGVRWIVFPTPIEASNNEIKRFTSIIHDNFRPIKELNSREIIIN